MSTKLIESALTFAKYEPISREHAQSTKAAKKEFQTAFLTLSSHQNGDERTAFISQLSGKAVAKATDWCQDKFDDKRQKLSCKNISETAVKEKADKFNKERANLYTIPQWVEFRKSRKDVIEGVNTLMNSATDFDQIALAFKAKGISDAIIAEIRDLADKYRI